MQMIKRNFTIFRRLKFSHFSFNPLLYIFFYFHEYLFIKILFQIVFFFFLKFLLKLNFFAIIEFIFYLLWLLYGILFLHFLLEYRFIQFYILDDSFFIIL